MLVLDSNNSPKRIKLAFRQWEAGDTCSLNNSNYFLSNTYVNSFKNEIHYLIQMDIKQGPKDETNTGDEGYITETDGPQLKNCTFNWKAATLMGKRKMWRVFDETGIFASIYFHRFAF